MQYTQSHFKREHEITIGVEFTSKNIKVGNTNLRIQIWDTVNHSNQGWTGVISIYNKIIL